MDDGSLDRHAFEDVDKILHGYAAHPGRLTRGNRIESLGLVLFPRLKQAVVVLPGYGD